MDQSEPRKIIHVDMDCFFAAVEIRENPQLRGRPVAVGGRPGMRGVVAACNYEARKFGVHSAMPMSQALQSCPVLIIQPVNMSLYKQVSSEIHAIFANYTDLIEPVSLDEAYLDVTDSSQCQGSATLIARDIRNKINRTQGLTASAGVAPNKLLAKIASDWHKPNGLTVIGPEDVDQFVRQIPVSRITGVGKVTALKMHELGIKTCLDLQTWSEQELVHQFGKFGHSLYQFCRGIDLRSVTPTRERKSLSVEDTFEQDLPDLLSCLMALNRVYEEFMRRYQQVQDTERLQVKNLFLKLRFDNFSTTTIQVGASQPKRVLYRRLCADAWQRGRRPVRLLGIGVQFFPSSHPHQLDLFG